MKVIGGRMQGPKGWKSRLKAGRENGVLRRGSRPASPPGRGSGSAVSSPVGFTTWKFFTLFSTQDGLFWHYKHCLPYDASMHLGGNWTHWEKVPPNVQTEHWFISNLHTEDLETTISSGLNTCIKHETGFTIDHIAVSCKDIKSQPTT